MLIENLVVHQWNQQRETTMHSIREQKDSIFDPVAGLRNRAADGFQVLGGLALFDEPSPLSVPPLLPGHFFTLLLNSFWGTFICFISPWRQSGETGEQRCKAHSQCSYSAYRDAMESGTGSI
jgi:hypothetical protein